MSSKKRNEIHTQKEDKFKFVVRATVDSILMKNKYQRTSNAGSIIQAKSNRNSLISKPFQMPMLITSERSVSQCQKSLFAELQAKVLLLNVGKEILLKDQDLPSQEYFKKHCLYVIKLQARIRGYLSRKQSAKLLKNQRHRFNVINELIITEEGYVNDLDITLNYIKVKMLESNIISKKKVETILSKYPNVFQLNKEFLTLLKQQDKANYRYLFEIGNVLNKISVYFKIYFEFYNDQAKSQSLMKELKANNPEFLEFTKDLKKDPKLRGLGCEGFMIKPVQRLPKYELLLNDFLRHTEADHPLKPLYQEALKNFKQVCEQNDANMKKYLQEIKMFDLQKTYGDPQNLEIVTNARAFISEERMTIIQDSFDKSVLVYFLSDMIVMCEEDDKSESGYRYFKHIIISERSHCQSIPNKRFLANLTKLIGKNQTITFMSESQELKDKLIHDLNSMIRNLKDRHSAKMQQGSNVQSDISVQIKGTQEREANTFSAYTVYVIEILIDHIRSQVFLRFSEIKSIDEIVQKEHPEIRVPHLASSLFGNKEFKTIENRKLQIEDFLLSLLINEDFQTKNLAFQQKILKLMRLDPNFYKFPQLLEMVSKMQHEKPKGSIDIESLIKKAQNFEEKISSGQLLRASVALQSSTGASESQVLSQSMPLLNETISVHVIFFDETKLDLQIPEWFRGSDLVQLIMEKINLQEVCDFRLFETDEQLTFMRLILDEELISPMFPKEEKNRLTNIFSNKKRKALIYRKYLYLPKLFEQTQEQLEIDSTRSRLLTFQLFYEIRQQQYQFILRDYYIFAALYLIITKQMKNNCFQFELLQKLLPTSILKQQSKSLWVQSVIYFYKQMESNITSFLTYKLTITDFDKQNKQDLAALELIAIDIELISNTSIRAGQVLQEIIVQHPIYGMNLFQIQVQKNDLNGIMDLTNKKYLGLNYYLGISNRGVHFLDENKKSELFFIRFRDIDDINVNPESVAIMPEGKKPLVIQTTQGFEIKNLIDDYEYLENELQKISV